MNVMNKSFYASLAMALSLPVMAQTADENNYSIGFGLNSYGLGVFGSAKTDWHLTDGDQIQIRAGLYGFDGDDIEDLDVNGIEYEGDISAGALTAGIDWFPFEGRFVEQIFFSTGLQFFDMDSDLTSDEKGDFTVGDQNVTEESNTKIATTYEQSGVAPYLSVGWGNRISSNSNWAFSAELGLSQPLSDADVTVTELNGGTVISQANLDKERMEIEDDLNGVQAFVSLGVSYRF